ncbi:hypothetical protein HDU67_008131 [Dinochytrium kinnereticum]|nr:hypothetical protein HDU67_008131 [Dinochytrium kinnereticum]
MRVDPSRRRILGPGHSTIRITRHGVLSIAILQRSASLIRSISPSAPSIQHTPPAPTPQPHRQPPESAAPSPPQNLAALKFDLQQLSITYFPTIEPMPLTPSPRSLIPLHATAKDRFQHISKSSPPRASRPHLVVRKRSLSWSCSVGLVNRKGLLGGRLEDFEAEPSDGAVERVVEIRNGDESAKMPGLSVAPSEVADAEGVIAGEDEVDSLASQVDVDTDAETLADEERPEPLQDQKMQESLIVTKEPTIPSLSTLQPTPDLPLALESYLFSQEKYHSPLSKAELKSLFSDHILIHHFTYTDAIRAASLEDAIISQIQQNKSTFTSRVNAAGKPLKELTDSTEQYQNDVDYWKAELKRVKWIICLITQDCIDIFTHPKYSTPRRPLEVFWSTLSTILRLESKSYLHVIPVFCGARSNDGTRFPFKLGAVERMPSKEMREMVGRLVEKMGGVVEGIFEVEVAAEMILKEVIGEEFVMD